MTWHWIQLCVRVRLLHFICGREIRFGFGQSYQWENSTNNTTWSIIQGANYPYYNVNFSGPMYYRCQVSCNAQTVSSTSVKILATDTALCYCSANLGGALCGSSWSRSNLTNVTISGTSLNNSNPICAVTNGSSINAFPPYGNSTATLLTGNTYSLSVTTSYNNSLAVWIDYNQNGIFESSEWKQITNSSTASVPSSTNLTIPQGIPTGKTGMRIRSIENISGTLTANSACINYITGETEDYIITIDLGNSIRKTPDVAVINISPNPASEELKISSTTILTGKSHLEITNASGQLIYMEELVNFTTKAIDISQFPKGIYFLKLTSTASLIIKKVILE
ncbi:MAG: T9SS type A sorting domain-containing protein [Bacteroidetes bacterium]|nr:T9SS type A sorting domain-containing protein [Bacteroidota bacterium]